MLIVLDGIVFFRNGLQYSNVEAPLPNVLSYAEGLESSTEEISDEDNRELRTQK